MQIRNNLINFKGLENDSEEIQAQKMLELARAKKMDESFRSIDKFRQIASNNNPTTTVSDNIAIKKIIPQSPQADTFTKKEDEEIKKNETIKKVAKTGGIIAGVITLVAGAVALAKKGRVKTADLPNFVLGLQDTKWHSEYGETIMARFTKMFNDNFIEPLKKGEVPKNGFLVEGPESEGKKQFFDWMIEQLKKQGVEVIDSTDPALGYPTRKSLSGICKELHPTATAKFKEDGKYRLFLVRGLEKMENSYKNTDSILKGGTHDCARNNGVILAYDCINPNNFYPAVTRPGRIDFKFSPSPLETEPLEKWKEFLTYIMPKNDPEWGTKQVQEAKEIFTKRGAAVLEEMKPYLKYNAPYKIPNTSTQKVTLDDWIKYIDATVSKLDEKQRATEFYEVAEMVVNEHLYGRIPKNEYQSIIDMIMKNTSVKYKEGLQKFIDSELKQRL